MVYLCRILFFALPFLLVTTSCSTSPSSNFYILTANSSVINTIKSHAANKKMTVGIGPVTVPDYLQRSQIVYFMKDNRLTVSSTDQWSEPLDKAISRVITINLSRLYPTRTTLTFPWRAENNPRLAVRISIIELNRQAVDRAVIEADWTVIDLKSKKTLHRDRFYQAIVIPEFSYIELAKSYSDLLALLSNVIDKKLRDY